MSSLPSAESIAKAIGDGISAGALNQFRWFAEKQRDLTSVEVKSSFVADYEASAVGFSIAELRFADGGTERYLVPFAITDDPIGEMYRLATVFWGDKRAEIVDGPLLDAFRRWLMQSLLSSASLETPEGRYRFTWEDQASKEDIESTLSAAETRLVGAEQSNSSVIYGTSAIVKLYRRLVEGVNPEFEIARHLARSGEASPVPALLATAEYSGLHGESYAVAIAQEHVGANQDLWEVLGEMLESDVPSSLELIAELGRSTADMHLALAHPSWDAAFTTELINAQDVLAWKEALHISLDRTLQLLLAARPRLHESDQQLVDLVLATRGALERQAEGFDVLVGRRKSRIHGDYHLGQVLYTAGGSIKIIDFEGEPKRSIAERRAKTSPIKDVAGMMRSLSYARGAAQRKQAQRSHTTPPPAAEFADWERTARRRFLDAYMTRVTNENPALVPESADDMRRATRAWELDKALYEVQYELSSRPDWLWLPLSSLVQRV